MFARGDEGFGPAKDAFADDARGGEEGGELGGGEEADFGEVVMEVEGAAVGGGVNEGVPHSEAGDDPVLPGLGKPVD